MTREDAIKKAIEDFEWAIHADNRSDISLTDMRMAVSALKEQPVVRGRWEFDGSDFADIWKCTVCGDEWFFEYDPRDAETLVKYCPNCGARMDGGGND